VTKTERQQILEAMRLFRTNDGYGEAMRILRVLTGGPKETPFEKTVREAKSVPVSEFFKTEQG
jgi:hypothetical protein